MASCAGCFNSTGPTVPEIYPALGTLTYRGLPVVETQLTFWGDNPSEPGFAQTDAEGKFKGMTNDSADGMPPGEYIVTVSSPRGGIPEKYTDPESSPLRVTIAGESDDELALTLED